MRRILVVANRTLGGEHLTDVLQERAASAPCRVHVVVPATMDPSGWTQDEGSANAEAAERLQAALQRIGEIGLEVTGEVGDHLPFEAVTDVLRDKTFDEIVVSTLPPGVSRWLRMDLVSRLERAVDIPVTHVMPSEAEVGSA